MRILIIQKIRLLLFINFLPFLSLVLISCYKEEPSTYCPCSDVTIAFSAGGPWHEDIYTICLDGSNLTLWTQKYNFTMADNPQWSSDGKYIYFYGDERELNEPEREGEHGIFRINTTDGTIMNVTKNYSQDVYAALISPDDTKLALLAGRWINIYNLLTRTNEVVDCYMHKLGKMKNLSSWSFDSKRFAFSAFDLSFPLEIAVVVADLERGKCNVVSENAKFIKYSNHNRRVAYTRECWPEDYNSHLFVANDDGSDKRRITKKCALIENIIWSPNDSLIAFAMYEEFRFNIWIARPDGSLLQKVTTQISNNNPYWIDNNKIVFMTDRNGPWELYLATLMESGEVEEKLLIGWEAGIGGLSDPAAYVNN